MSYGQQIQKKRERMKDRDNLLSELDRIENQLASLENTMGSGSSSVSSQLPREKQSRRKSHRLPLPNLANHPALEQLAEELVKRQIKLCIRAALQHQSNHELLLVLLNTQDQSIRQLEQLYEFAKMLNLLEHGQANRG